MYAYRTVYASQTTIAEAMPASWDSDRCTVRDAELRGPGLDRTGDHEVRPAAVVGAHLGVVPRQPAGAPSALASASLAANRAASDAIGRSLPQRR